MVASISGPVANLYICSSSSVMVISMRETGWQETDMARAS